MKHDRVTTTSSHCIFKIVIKNDIFRIKITHKKKLMKTQKKIEKKKVTTITLFKYQLMVHGLLSVCYWESYIYV